MVVIKHKGDLKKTERFLKENLKLDVRQALEQYAQQGVQALMSATPVDSGLTASSWGYEITVSRGSFSIAWTNSNVVQGVPIAIILQYGHGTGSGGYVQGRDYINPALQPIFDEIAGAVWQEVTKQ